MARQAKVIEEERAPATLPADFSEWDSAEPPATLPDNFSDFDSALVPGTALKPAVAAPAEPARPVARRPEFTVSRPAAVHPEAAELSVPLPAFRTELAADLKPEIEGRGKGKGAGKLVGFGAAVVVIVLAVVAYSNYAALFKPAPKAVTVSHPEVQQEPAPPISTPSGLPKPSPTAPPAAQQQATTASEGPALPSAQSENMKNQLNAAPRIPKSIAPAPSNEAPSPGFGAGADLGVNPALGGLPSQSRPNVKVEGPRIVNLSAGVVQGLLIHKTNPVYPPLAKAARVSGTVVLEVTISKAGTIEGMHVVSGPEMLRQAAMDAVRTWRYKPYRLDNEPVEVDATVNVVFVIGG